MAEQTAAVSAIIADVRGRFPGVTFQVFNCRKIARSDRWSQHAYGNAVDIFAPRPVMDQVFAHLTARRPLLPIHAICYRSYGGCNAADHQDHIHVEGAPAMRGTPECAGGRPAPASPIGVDIDVPTPGWVDALSVLTGGETWVRVAQVVGGGALVVGGLLMLGRTGVMP